MQRSATLTENHKSHMDNEQKEKSWKKKKFLMKYYKKDMPAQEGHGKMRLSALRNTL